MMFLLGARNIDGTLPVEEGAGVESVLQSETSGGCILPIVAELPEKGDAYVDVESLAHELGHCLLGIEEVESVDMMDISAQTPLLQSPIDNAPIHAPE